MFARKLKALEFYDSDGFNLKDEQKVRNLVVWLEDQKIRHYKIEDRDKLRDTDSPQWVAVLKKYLADLKCPVENLSNKSAVVNWLISHAVQLAFSEDGERYNAEVEKKKKTTIPSDSWIYSVNSDDAELRKGIESLRKLLLIPSHPDHIIVLQAIAKLIEERLSDTAIQKYKSSKKKEYFKLESIPLGFDTNDYVVNETAKILRLLQIHNLRQLQTRINESIVAMQKISADPKTDQSLGRVGR